MIKGILLFITTMMFLLLTCILIFTHMGVFLVADHELVEADAIVLLNSGLDTKVPEAADVFLDGYADVIITAQTYLDETLLILRERGIPQERIIILPGQVMSTRDEALAVRDYLAQNTDINTFILVTTKSHTRRSLMIFTRTLKSLDRDVVIISRASRYDSFQSERWWKDPQSIRIVNMEYLKIFYYFYLEFFDGNEGPLKQVLQFYNRVIQLNWLPADFDL